MSSHKPLPSYSVTARVVITSLSSKPRTATKETINPYQLSNDKGEEYVPPLFLDEFRRPEWDNSPSRRVYSNATTTTTHGLHILLILPYMQSLLQSRNIITGMCLHCQPRNHLILQPKLPPSPGKPPSLSFPGGHGLEPASDSSNRAFVLSNNNNSISTANNWIKAT